MSFSALTLLHGWATAIVTAMTYYVSVAVADVGGRMGMHPPPAYRDFLSVMYESQKRRIFAESRARFSVKSIKLLPSNVRF